MSSSTANKTTIILREQKDWNEWIEIVRSIARKANIWPLINRDSPGIPTPLREPVVPNPSSIRAGASSFVGFSPEEHGTYRVEIERYLREEKAYQSKSDAIAEMCVKIQELVDRKHLTYTFGANGPYEMLVKLKARFAPTTYGREREILARWTRLQNPRSQDLEMWLQEYETAYNDCIRYDVSADVKGEKAFYAFTQSISLIDYNWARAQEIQIAGEEDPDYDIGALIKKYRIFSENITGLHQPKGSHGVFAATF